MEKDFAEILHTCFARSLYSHFHGRSIRISNVPFDLFPEWGDRSQIATITLASHLDPIGVTIGAIAGHSVCTGLAVIGGEPKRLLFTLYCSKRSTGGDEDFSKDSRALWKRSFLSICIAQSSLGLNLFPGSL